MASLSLLAKYSCLFSKDSTVKRQQTITFFLHKLFKNYPSGADVVFVTQSEEGLLQVSLHLLPDALLHVVRTVALIPLKD